MSMLFYTRDWWLAAEKTTQTDIFALPASLFAVLLLLLATCLATSSQARSQSAEERNEWDRSKAIAKFLATRPDK